MPDTLLFARHGATACNLAGRRCGGDHDVPLAPAGRAQARALATTLRRRRPLPGLIVTSALARTRETAEIVAAATGLEIVVEPLLAERSLGGWNGLPVEAALPWLAPGVVPPGGGESNEQFVARIGTALRRSVWPLLPRRPLVVGSRGVARVLGIYCGFERPAPAANGELIVYPTAALGERLAGLPAA